MGVTVQLNWELDVSLAEALFRYSSKFNICLTFGLNKFFSMVTLDSIN